MHASLWRTNLTLGLVVSALRLRLPEITSLQGYEPDEDAPSRKKTEVGYYHAPVGSAGARGHDGVLPESVMPDALHHRERGYQIWAEAMEPMLARLMGDEPIR